MSFKTAVASTVCNLAGDKISDFVAATALGTYAFNENGNPNFGENLLNGILKGQAFNFRRYYNWLTINEAGIRYNEMIGHKDMSFIPSLEVSQASLLAYLKGEDTEHCYEIEEALVGDADFQWFADKWVAENHPELINEDYEIDYKDDLISIIVNENTGYTFSADNYNNSIQYLYIKYKVYDATDDDLDNTDDTYSTALDQWNSLSASAQAVTPKPQNPADNLDNIPYSYLIYGHNTGNAALDDMFPRTVNTSSFIFPPIPFRLNNVQVSEAEQYEELHTLSQRAMRRAIGQNQYKRIDKGILDSESLRDLDYAYIAFGSSLNTKDWAGKEYIYKFFELLYETYGNVAGTIKIEAKDSNLGFEFRIKYSSIEKGYITNPTADLTFKNKDHYCFIHETSYPIFESEDYSGPMVIEETYLYHLLDRDDYVCEYLKITNLTHENHVYKGKYVKISAKDALNDTETSGFIVPLHEGVLRQMSAIKATQLGNACAYMVYNSYVRKHIHWYQRWLGAIIAVIVVVVIIIVCVVTENWEFMGFAGETWSSLTGFFGSIGITGVAAKIAAALTIMAASALAGTIINKILVAILTPIVGKQMAALFGAIFSTIILMGMSAYINGANTLSAQWNTLCQPKNLVYIGLSCINGYSQMVAVKTLDYQRQTGQFQAEADQKNKELSSLGGEIFGNNGTIALAENIRRQWEISETPDTFIRRSLLLGSDIAWLTVNIPSMMADVTLQRNLPGIEN